MPKVHLDDAEAELIKGLRSGKALGVFIMLKEVAGEWMVSLTAPPFETTAPIIGTGFTFAEAWRARMDTTALMRELASSTEGEDSATESSKGAN
jgi:hypothetical protein